MRKTHIVHRAFLRFERKLSFILIICTLSSLFYPLAISAHAEVTGAQIDGRITSKEKVSLDGIEVELRAGTLYWKQSHNPIVRTSVSGTVFQPDKKSASVAYTALHIDRDALSILEVQESIASGGYDSLLAFTALYNENYVYYNTVGMRFTLENVAVGSDGSLIRDEATKNNNIATIDIGSSGFSWKNTFDPSTGSRIAYVDVLWDRIDSSNLSIGARSRLSELSAGTNGIVYEGTSLSHTDMKDNSSGTIISHYYIEDFLLRDAAGSILRDCVVGQLILQKFGGDETYLQHLPAGEWRVYATHILQNIDCPAIRGADNSLSLAPTAERSPRKVDGKIDLHVTEYSMLSSAGWSTQSATTYIPALYNRYVRLENSSLATTDISVRYYNSAYGTEAAGSHVVKTQTHLLSGQTINGEKTPGLQMELSYKADSSLIPDNLSLDLDMDAYDAVSSSEGRVRTFRGLSIVAGNDESHTLADNIITGDEYGISFYLNRGAASDRYLICPAIFYDSEERDRLLDFSAPYACVWVPLESHAGVTIKYVESDTSDAILKKTRTIRLDSSTGRYALDTGLYVTDVAQELDALGYEISDPTLKSSFFVCGTQGWDYTTSSRQDRKLTLQHAKTLKDNGAAYGVINSGTGKTANFTYSEQLTDIVFYVYVTKKDTPHTDPPVDDTQNVGLIVRYVVADGTAHLLKDYGPVSIGANSHDIEFSFAAESEITVGSDTYVPINDDDVYFCERPLYGMYTTKSGIIPVTYANAVKPSNSGKYIPTTTSFTGDLIYKISVPRGAVEAMLYIPCRKKAEESGDVTVNIYYINKDSSGGKYFLLNSDTRQFPAGQYPAESSVFTPVAISNDITDTSSGAHWKPTTAIGSDCYDYAVVMSSDKDVAIGMDHYPFQRADDFANWQRADWYRQINTAERTSSVYVVMTRDARTYEIFVPCEVRTGNNPVRFYAVDAQTGRQLSSNPVSTTFLDGTSGLIDVHDIEELDFTGSTYVMVNSELEAAGAYPARLTALSFNISTSAVSPFSVNNSYASVQAKAMIIHFEAIGDESAGQRQERYVYLDIDGYGIPSGNIVAVYVPYRKTASVNVYMLGDDCLDADPCSASLQQVTYTVSRSYWYKTDAAISYNSSLGGNSLTSGTFDFELPSQIEDSEGETYFLTDDTLAAIHDDTCCNGTLQLIGKQAAQCTLCKGTGLINVLTECPDCGGEGHLFCCETCHDTGKVVTRYIRKSDGSYTYSSVCPDCNGSCRCRTCDGSGLVLTPEIRCPQCDGAGIRIAAINFNTISGEELVRRLALQGTSSVAAIKTQCYYCHGTGHTHTYTCTICGGDGRKNVSYDAGDGYYHEHQDAENCSACAGTGDVRYTKCSDCNGRGYTTVGSYGHYTYPTCETCNGTGAVFNEIPLKNCPECNSSGGSQKTVCVHCNGRGTEYYTKSSNQGTGSRICSVCHGTGTYVCHTCDGSGYVDYDLCTRCYEPIYLYSSGDNNVRLNIMQSGTLNYQSVYRYGSGYTVTYRTCCRYCNDTGYTLCPDCHGSGWSPTQVNTYDNNHALPCSRCGGRYYYVERQWKDSYYGGYWEPAHYDYYAGTGEAACTSCTDTSYYGQMYNSNPDGAENSAHPLNRGQSYTRDDGTSYKSRSQYLRSGFYCADCGSYIFPLSYPRDAIVQYQKDSHGKIHLTVYKKNTPRNSTSYSYYTQSEYDAITADNPYREVTVVDGPIEVNNHSPCGLQLIAKDKRTYNEALLDSAHQVPVWTVENSEGGESAGDTVKTTVYIPDDSYTKATDVYAIYTPWQPFPTPQPLPTLTPVPTFDRDEDIHYGDNDTTVNTMSIVASESNEDDYDVLLGIPSSESVQLLATAKEYLLDMDLSNTVGVMEIPVTVRFPYALYESGKDYRDGAEPYETGLISRNVIVRRTYSYWSVDGFAMYGLESLIASNKVIASTTDDSPLLCINNDTSLLPQFELVHEDGSGSHVMIGDNCGQHSSLLADEVEADYCLENGEDGYILTLDMTYVDVKRGGLAPELPELDLGYAQQVADAGIGDITVINDTLVFDGKKVLDSTPVTGTSAHAPQPDLSDIRTAGIATWLSSDYIIPPRKTNGRYETNFAYTDYVLMDGSLNASVSHLRIDAASVNDVFVHTPVYVEGFVSGSDNIGFVQLTDADVESIYTVLGENCDYLGYSADTPNQAYCTSDLTVVLSNTGAHLEYPGYGQRTYDRYIYNRHGPPNNTHSGICNQISFSTAVVIDRSEGDWSPDYICNESDLTLDAGEWVNVPADTPLRVIIPEDTPEGEYTVTFASVAINDANVDNPLQGAMHHANLFYMSHSVYDRITFNVVGKVSALTLRQRINATGSRTDLGERVGHNNSIGLPSILQDARVLPSGRDGSVKAGYTYVYELETVGTLLNATDSRLEIIPTIYYVPAAKVINDSDGVVHVNDRISAQKVDIWYDNGYSLGTSSLAAYNPTEYIHILSDGYGEVRQKRSFTFSIPSGYHVCLAGTNVSELLAGRGINFREDFWITDGYLIVGFEIRVHYTEDDSQIHTLLYNNRYTSMQLCNMWKLEGYDTGSGFMYGDVMITRVGDSIFNDYLVDHLN